MAIDFRCTGAVHLHAREGFNPLHARQRPILATLPVNCDGKCRECKSRRAVRILIVEDNPIEARLLKAMIEGQSGEAFVTIIETLEKMTAAKHGEFDIALVDLNLPDADPQQVIDALEHFDIPVAVITGHGYPDIAGQVGRKLGLPIMIKPSSRLDIESIARNVIGLAEYREQQERELQELRQLRIFNSPE